jgi:hypothetical protein
VIQKYPPLFIHAWGGLGSQLFAISLAFQLKERFPRRRQVIVLHTGGVTKRYPEIIALFPEFDYLEEDDFRPRLASSESNPVAGNKGFNGMKRSLALLTRFLAEENDDKTRKVLSWTLSVRGHYLYRKVDPKFLSTLLERLKKVDNVEENVNSKEIVIHYRLGDLISLTEKSPIEPARIFKVLENLDTTKTIKILSDSPETASKLLSSSSHDLKFKALELSTASTLLVGAQAGSFVGTSSKISYWIVLLRLYMNNSSINFLPRSDYSLMNILSGRSNDIRYF